MNIISTSGDYIINGISGTIPPNKFFCVFYGYDDKIKVDLYHSDTMELLFRNLWMSEIIDQNGNKETDVIDFVNHYYNIIVGYRNEVVNLSTIESDWYYLDGDFTTTVTMPSGYNKMRIKQARNIQILNGFNLNITDGLVEGQNYYLIIDSYINSEGTPEFRIQAYPDQSNQNFILAIVNRALSTSGSNDAPSLAYSSNELRLNTIKDLEYQIMFKFQCLNGNLYLTNIALNNITAYGDWEIDTTGIDASNASRDINNVSATLKAPYRFRRSTTGDNYEYIPITDSNVTVTTTNCSINKATGQVDIGINETGSIRSVKVYYKYQDVEYTWEGGKQDPVGKWEMDTATAGSQSDASRVINNAGQTLNGPTRYRRNTDNGYQYVYLSDSSITINSTNCSVNRSNGYITISLNETGSQRSASVVYSYKGVSYTYQCGKQNSVGKWELSYDAGVDTSNAGRSINNVSDTLKAPYRFRRSTDSGYQYSTDFSTALTNCTYTKSNGAVTVGLNESGSNRPIRIVYTFKSKSYTWEGGTQSSVGSYTLCYEDGVLSSDSGRHVKNNGQTLKAPFKLVRSTDNGNQYVNMTDPSITVTPTNCTYTRSNGNASVALNETGSSRAVKIVFTYRSIQYTWNGGNQTSVGLYDLDTSTITSNPNRSIKNNGQTFNGPTRFRRSTDNGYQYINISDSRVTITPTNCTVNKSNGVITIPLNESQSTRQISAVYKLAGSYNRTSTFQVGKQTSVGKWQFSIDAGVQTSNPNRSLSATGQNIKCPYRFYRTTDEGNQYSTNFTVKTTNCSYTKSTGVVTIPINATTSQKTVTLTYTLNESGGVISNIFQVGKQAVGEITYHYEVTKARLTDSSYKNTYNDPVPASGVLTEYLGIELVATLYGLTNGVLNGTVITNRTLQLKDLKEDFNITATGVSWMVDVDSDYYDNTINISDNLITKLPVSYSFNEVSNSYEIDTTGSTPGPNTDYPFITLQFRNSKNEIKSINIHYNQLGNTFELVPNNDRFMRILTESADSVSSYSKDFYIGNDYPKFHVGLTGLSTWEYVRGSERGGLLPLYIRFNESGSHSNKMIYMRGSYADGSGNFYGLDRSASEGYVDIDINGRGPRLNQESTNIGGVDKDVTLDFSYYIANKWRYRSEVYNSKSANEVFHFYLEITIHTGSYFELTKSESGGNYSRFTDNRIITYRADNLYMVE